MQRYYRYVTTVGYYLPYKVGGTGVVSHTLSQLISLQSLYLQ